jgi:hypothetical protein
MGTFGIAPDLGRSRAVSCLDRRYHVYRFHQLVPEGRQHIDVFSCVLYRMFQNVLPDMAKLNDLK